ncbi:hypothetical protein TNCV_3027701 [Trichonephila clavipes]|nr:hypothetical protein TNCV_3027701 [Trichonephila clavipes]
MADLCSNSQTPTTASRLLHVFYRLFIIITLVKLQQHRGSSTVITDFLQLEASILDELSPTCKTICRNRGRRKNVPSELTSTKVLTSTK